MKSTYYAVIAALVIVGSASFLAGRLTTGDRAAASEATESDLRATKSSRPQATADFPDRPGRTRQNSDRPDTGESVSAEALASEMRTLLDDPNAFDRSRSWLEFLEGLSDDQFLDVITAFREGGLPRERMSEYAMLLSAWAERDPLAALENTGKLFARQTILATWAITAPDAALRWAESNHEGDGANPLLVGVIRGIASHDPLWANEIMSTMPYSRERDRALDTLLPKIAAMGADEARQWADAIDDDRLRAGAVSRLAARFAAEDPQGTADWLVANSGDAVRSSMDDVIATWMRQDKDAAVGYFEQLPIGEARSHALRGIVNSMALDEPASAAQFLDNHETDANDRAVQQFVWLSLGKDPELAVTYIDRIDNQRDQEQIYQRTLDWWLRNDESAAMAWMADNTLPEPVLNHLERDLERRRQAEQ
ncbi:hypothetical protein N9F70_01315 [bacterium]|nr:hypothetical protein [bacterium]